MTPDAARAIVDKIRSEAEWDDEAAHADEDNLYTLVLAEVVVGNPNAKELAEIALSTSNIKFARWCA